MSAVRLLLCDVDGTLVRHDKSLSDPVIAAVGRAVGAGIEVSIISARPPSGMVWIARKLGLTRTFAAFNGGTLCDPDGTVRSAEHVSEPQAQAALALIDQPGIDPWVFADGKWYARTSEGAHAERERGSAGIEPTVITDFGPTLARADKIVGVCDDHDRLAKLEPKVAAVVGEAGTVARSQLYYLDVTPRTGNKGDGIAEIAAACGVALEAVAVIGDQRNDLAMFARAGLSIAMAQGPEDVRAAATHVTLSNDEDGVAYAIDTWILPGAHT